MNNIGRAFSFMFEDKGWLGKIVIGGLFCLLSLVVVGIPFVFGYMLEMAKRSSENKEIPLPEWDNLGDKFIRGLIYFVILIIYSLPGLILYFIPCIGSFCLGPLWWLVVLFVTPYITVKYSLTGNFGDAFQFNEIVNFIKLNFTNVFIVVLMSIALSVISHFGVLLLVVGIFFAWFWAILGISYLYGQLYSVAQKAEVKPVSSQT
ncbi:MAG: DUF4013 domain-containing protein [candidate division Zixibacteria bacterium]|nr:DUF4013 domain-containing protein [candidate division Zixibacteria bacterium]